MTLTTLSLSLLLFAAMVRGDVMCPAKFVALGERCYRFFPDKQLQFGPAAGLCSREKSELVGLESKEEEDDVTKYLAEHHGDVTSWRTGGMKFGGKFVWHNKISGSKPIKYTHWPGGRVQSGSSIILKKTQNGQYKWAGEWMGSHSQRPRYQHAVICETKPLKVITTPACPPDWSHLQSTGKCYRQFPHPATYSSARRQCEAEAGTLAMPKTEEISRELAEITQKWFWIGLDDLNKQDIFTWVDGEVGKWIPWGANQPDGHKNGKKEDCVLMHKAVWNDYPCNSRHKFVCERGDTTSGNESNQQNGAA